MSMIIQDDIDWSLPGVKAKKMEDGTPGTPIALIVDNEVALTMAVDKEFADLIINASNFIEDPECDESNRIFIISFNKDNKTFRFRCTEMVYVILLSNPLIIEITESYNNYRYVAPGWNFINNEFIFPEVQNEE